MKPEERKAWVEFMAARLAPAQYIYSVDDAARDADRALEEYRKRFPTLPSNWQQDPAPFV